MSKAKRYSESDIPDITNRSLFFDANILIYLYFTQTGQDLQEIYSRVFKKLLNTKNITFALDFVVLSEVINIALKEEYKLTLTENSNLKYKDFRDSPNGINALKNIHSIIEDMILPRFSIAGKKYDKTSLSSLLVENGLDFNDKHICKLCEENQFILFTHDRDFKNSDIEILSMNSNLSA